MSEFFAMGGYAGYVWSSYGIAAIVLFLNAFSSWRRYQSILHRLKRLESK